MKLCTKCDETKPLDAFWRSRRNRDGRQSFCKSCMRKTKPLYPQVRPPGSRRTENLAKYGMTADDYEALLAEQEGVCAICKQAETKLHRTGRLTSLSVDHDHNTGAVRGLLCNRCNRALGLLHDSAEMLASAATYLAKAEVRGPSWLPRRPATLAASCKRSGDEG